jgi:uncharacterized membrane protein (UPF0136 family)
MKTRAGEEVARLPLVYSGKLSYLTAMVAFAKAYYFIFSILTIGGGIMGFVKKGSVISLVSGTICGVALLIAALLLPQRFQIALVIGLLVSVLLAGKFIPDFVHRKALLPGGLMAILSVGGLIVTLLAWYRR